MISCPQCSATLPPETTTCQFCGRDVSKVYRRADVSVHEAYASKKTRKSAWIWYSAIGLFWVIEGVFHVVGGMGLLTLPLSPLLMVVGAVLLVIGAGFLLKSYVFRTSYHLLCMVVLVAGVATAIDGVRISGTLGSAGIIVAALGGLSSLSAGLMSYLSGRTMSTFAR